MEGGSTPRSDCRIKSIDDSSQYWIVCFMHIDLAPRCCHRERLQMLLRCPDCRSRKLIWGEVFAGSRNAESRKVLFKPDEVLGQGQMATDVSLAVNQDAFVCFDCGFLGSHIDVGKLRECVAAHGLESLKKKLELTDGGRDSGSGHSATDLCLACGTTIPESGTRCPDCGWSRVVGKK